MQIPSRGGFPRPRPVAFTLVELLAVMAVIVIILGFVLPSTTSLFATRTATAAAYAIGDTFEQARAYAMGNNTYVFLGIAEYDATNSAASDQTPATPTTTGGRVVVMAVASRDGTSIYDPNTLTGWTPTTSRLQPIMAPQVFSNLQVGNYAGGAATSGTGSLTRPTATYNLGTSMGSTSQYLLPIFSYPLPTTSASPPTYPPAGHYPFETVLVFDPQGAVHLVGSTGGGATSDTVPKLVELDLQQTHGATVPAAPADNLHNYLALQSVGMAGATRVYK